MVKIDKELGLKFLEALRSGKYEQTMMMMVVVENGVSKYCAMGLFLHILGVSDEEIGIGCAPGNEDACKKAIQSVNRCDGDEKEKKKTYGVFMSSLMILNDSSWHKDNSLTKSENTFSDIADYFEKNCELV
jgi:hypothetical protein